MLDDLHMQQSDYHNSRPLSSADSLELRPQTRRRGCYLAMTCPLFSAVVLFLKSLPTTPITLQLSQQPTNVNCRTFERIWIQFLTQAMTEGIFAIKTEKIKNHAAKAWAEVKPLADVLPRPRHGPLAPFFGTPECDTVLKMALDEYLQKVLSLYISSL